MVQFYLIPREEIQERLVGNRSTNPSIFYMGFQYVLKKKLDGSTKRIQDMNNKDDIKKPDELCDTYYCKLNRGGACKSCIKKFCYDKDGKPTTTDVWYLHTTDNQQSCHTHPVAYPLINCITEVPTSRYITGKLRINTPKSPYRQKCRIVLRDQKGNHCEPSVTDIRTGHAGQRSLEVMFSMKNCGNVNGLLDLEIHFNLQFRVKIYGKDNAYALLQEEFFDDQNGKALFTFNQQPFVQLGQSYHPGQHYQYSLTQPPPPLPHIPSQVNEKIHRPPEHYPPPPLPPSSRLRNQDQNNNFSYVQNNNEEIEEEEDEENDMFIRTEKQQYYHHHHQQQHLPPRIQQQPQHFPKMMIDSQLPEEEKTELRKRKSSKMRRKDESNTENRIDIIDPNSGDLSGGNIIYIYFSVSKSRMLSRLEDNERGRNLVECKIGGRDAETNGIAAPFIYWEVEWINRLSKPPFGSDNYMKLNPDLRIAVVVPKSSNHGKVDVFLKIMDEVIPKRRGYEYINSFKDQSNRKGLVNRFDDIFDHNNNNDNLGGGDNINDDDDNRFDPDGYGFSNLGYENDSLDFFGASGYHYAAAQNKLEDIKKYVAEKKGDFRKSDSLGFSPLDVARYFNNKDVYDYLLSQYELRNMKKEEFLLIESKEEEEEEEQQDEEGEKKEKEMMMIKDFSEVKDRKVYVENLDHHTTPHDLLVFFTKNLVELESIDMGVKDPQPEKIIPYAYITFQTDDDVLKAIQMQGMKFQHKPLFFKPFHQDKRLNIGLLRRNIEKKEVLEVKEQEEEKSIDYSPKGFKKFFFACQKCEGTEDSKKKIGKVSVDYSEGTISHECQAKTRKVNLDSVRFDKFCTRHVLKDESYHDMNPKVLLNSTKNKRCDHEGCKEPDLEGEVSCIFSRKLIQVRCKE